MRDPWARILVVDDEPAVVDFLARALRGSARKVKSCLDAQAAIEQAVRERPDLLVADLGLPGMNGVELSRKLQEVDPDLEVILITGDSVDWARQALPAHADWVAKPFQGPRLRWVAERALERHRLRRENRMLAAALQHALPGPLAGARSQTIRFALNQAETFVQGHENLLWISGESGVGKRSLARWVHEAATGMGEASAPLLMLNGYEADPHRLDDLAEGTLVVLHAEAMPAAFGQALLRRHEESVAGRLPTVLRTVFLSESRHLPWSIGSGALEGLGHLLEAQHIHLPPLRERREDVFPLLGHILQDWAKANDKPLPPVEPAAMRRIESHPWPGNARELRETVAAAMTLDASVLKASSLSLSMKAKPSGIVELDGIHGKTLDAIEKQVLLATLNATQGDKAETARQLGISLRTLYRKLRLQASDRSDGAVSE